MTHNLEKDITYSSVICDKLQHEEYAQKLYAALCNMQWRHKDHDDSGPFRLWSCSWRYSGGIVSDIRNMHHNTDEDYIDWYCSGNEGSVSEEVEADLKTLGWEPVEWPSRS